MQWPIKHLEDQELLFRWRKLPPRKRLVLLKGLQLAGGWMYEFSNPERLSKIDDLNSKSFPQSARYAVESSFQRYWVQGKRYKFLRAGFNVLKFVSFVRMLKKALEIDRAYRRSS